MTKKENKDKFPLVLILMVKKKKFLFDAKSFLLIEVSDDDISAIHNYYFGLNREDISLEIKELMKYNVCLPGPLDKLTPNKDQLRMILKKQIRNYVPRKLMIEVTEECSLRCKYCFFTNKESNRRKHSERTMPLDIAYRAIDYYYERYSSVLQCLTISEIESVVKKNPPNLSWWGGEPLTNFELLIKTKKYFEDKNWEKYGLSKKDFVYVIATNLTILNSKIIDFFIENNIHLLVSLDGGEKEHDANRLFPNGQGSFNIVMKNILYLIEKNPIYSKENIILQPVWSENIDISKAAIFFKNNFNLDTVNRKILGAIPSFQRKEYVYMSELEKEVIKKSSINSFETILLDLSNRTKEYIWNLLSINKDLYLLFKQIVDLEKKLIFDNPNGSNFHSKMFSCPIGCDSIFVASEGSLFACCKTDYSYPIGDVGKGIDEEKIISLYESYHTKISLQCKNCWAFPLCSICPAMVCWNGTFSLPEKSECDFIKKQKKILLKQYILLTQEYEYLYLIIIDFFNHCYNYRFDSSPLNVTEV